MALGVLFFAVGLALMEAPGGGTRRKSAYERHPGEANTWGKSAQNSLQSYTFIQVLNKFYKNIKKQKLYDLLLISDGKYNKISLQSGDLWLLVDVCGCLTDQKPVSPDI